MTDDSIFAAALAIGSPAERAAFLNRVCVNPVLRKEIDELLAAHASSNLLDRPPADLARTGAFESEGDGPAAAPGDRVGPYKLLERIGEGGMGEVWVADQQEPIKRRVALKLIKPGMDSRAVLARFEAERQALAVMDHPNIAKVLDAGTTPDGRPFFVMELVKGTPITEFCDARKLSSRERLELFIPVCQAIQHAHMKGIIHRDIKPSNVLVALHDETPVPKVIDFGVAKAIGQQLTEKTIYTGFGALIGTPAYMAPEQATFNQLDVDTRADVYALGVLLYELLTGTPPVEPERLKKAALDEVLRIVRDEEPPRPSQRLSTSQAKATIAAVRQSDPAKLSNLLRGEVDWIVMKALEKDRTRRYDTATALAKDVQRYLTGDAVEACPPTIGYRLRKAYRRNRAAVLTTAGFLILLLAGAVLSSYGFISARKARDVANGQREEAQGARRREHEQWLAANAARFEAVDQRDAAVRAGSELKRANYFSNIGLAAASLESGQIVHVRELLERTRPVPGEPGNFEWHYLRRAIHGEKTTHPAGEHGAIAVAFSPNGTRLAELYASNNGIGKQPAVVRVWDQTNNREAYRRDIDATFARGIAFSPDGSLLAAWGDSYYFRKEEKWQGQLRIWDAASGKEYSTWRSEKEFVHAIAFSPDGKTMAIVRRTDSVQFSGFTITEINTSTGKDLESHALPPDQYDATVAYDTDGVLLAAWYGNGGSIRFRRGKREIAIPSDLATGQPYDIFFNGAGTRLGVFRVGNHVRIWDVTADVPKLAGSFLADGATVASRFVLNPSGRLCAVAQGYYGQKAAVWDVQSGQQVQVLRGHMGVVNAVAYSPDGRTLATASNDRTVKLWEAVPEHDDAPEQPAATVTVHGLAARADDRQVWLGNIFRPNETGRRFVVRDVASNTPPLLIGPPAKKLTDLFSQVRLSADGSRVVTQNWEEPNRAVVWDVANRRKSPEFPPDGLPAISSTFANDHLLVVQRPDHVIQVWDVRNGMRIAELPGHTGTVYRATASEDGRILATSDSAKCVRVWDLPAAKPLHVFQLESSSANTPRAFFAVALNADSTLLAFSDDDQGVRIRDLRTGREVHRLIGHAGAVVALAFTPDGNRLFTGGDSTVKIWDMAGGQEIMTFRHSGRIMDLALSRDGRRLATTQNTLDGRPVNVFDATPLEPKK